MNKILLSIFFALVVNISVSQSFQFEPGVALGSSLYHHKLNQDIYNFDGELRAKVSIGIAYSSAIGPGAYMSLAFIRNNFYHEFAERKFSMTKLQFEIGPRYRFEKIKLSASLGFFTSYLADIDIHSNAEEWDRHIKKDFNSFVLGTTISLSKTIFQSGKLEFSLFASSDIGLTNMARTDEGYFKDAEFVRHLGYQLGVLLNIDPSRTNN